ncbi:MAG: TRAP transporter small permease subunit [Rhizobiaceae bacterium]|nr:TRAP transporter small permease subunit [Rhizobiaceae bacterium]
MTSLADALDRVNRTVGGVVCWCALAMMLLQFIVVLLRYVFGVSSIALDESVLYLHSTLFMLGAGYTLLMNGHVRVDIFYAKASRRRQSAIDLFGHLTLLLPSMIVLIYWTWPSVRNSWAILEGPISVGGIPASFLLKSLIPAFCVLLIVQSVSGLLRDIARLRENA